MKTKKKHVPTSDERIAVAFERIADALDAKGKRESAAMATIDAAAKLMIPILKKAAKS